MKSYVTPLIIALSVVAVIFFFSNASKDKFKTTETTHRTGLAGSKFYKS